MKLEASSYNTEICYCTKSYKYYDTHFSTPGRPRSLEEAILEAHRDMEFYGFSEADVVDSETGEILAMIRKQKQGGFIPPSLFIWRVAMGHGDAPFQNSQTLAIFRCNCATF